MESKTKDIQSAVADYYSSKLAEHGETPQGVDWNGEEGQTRRFEQLIKVIERPAGFSLNDLGCGYGALYNFLAAHFSDIVYDGCDISADMIRSAKSRYENISAASFHVSAEPPRQADYSVASGIFNVRLGRSDGEWYDYLCETLDVLDRASERGFAFNCLTSYSDSDKMRDYLYYADPCILFDLCKRRYSRNVSLLHDYGLYEFTIIVRKSA
jgi:hypothetical protein